MWFVRKMRQLPELRSRTNNEPRVVTDSPKRLKNGLSSRTRNHVRTRSQAKVSVGLRKKLSTNAKSPQTKTAALSHVQRSKANLSRYSNRLNGLPRKRTSVNTLGSPKWKHAKRGPGRPSGSRTGVRKTTTSVAVKCAGEDRKRLLKQRLRRKDKIREGKSEKEKLANQRAIAAERRTDRLNKRRSALWVLNCEAESFLFGETAADKHEVELPPLSSPPKKRRIRANELGTLLKETPLLSTKLRSPVKTPPKDEDANSTISCCSKPSKSKSEKDNARNALSKPPKLVPSSSQSDFEKNLDLLNTTDDDDDILPPYLSREPVNYELSPIASPLSMYSNFSGENSMQHFPVKSSKYQSARIDTIVTSMEWKYSFEELPSDEVWYSTFKRQEQHSEALSPEQKQSNVCCSKNHSFTPLLLPYEARLLANRSPFKRRGGRLPRKSPRCHASTLAILSSLKRGRGRSSLCSPVPSAGTSGSQTTVVTVEAQMKVENVPLSPVEPIAVAAPAPVPKIRKIPKRKELAATPLTLLEPPTVICPRPSALPPVSPPLLSPVSSPGSPSPSSSTSFSSRLRNREMSATQYLWDSIQLLSDPYVIQVLAGEEEKTPPPKLKLRKLTQTSRADVNLKNGMRSLANGLPPRSAATNPSKTKGPRIVSSANSRGFSLSNSNSTGGTNGKLEMSEKKERISETSEFGLKTCKKAASSNKCNITSEKVVSERKTVDSVKALKFNDGGANGKTVATVTLSSARLTKSRLNSGDSESDYPKNGRQNTNSVKLKFTNGTVNGHSFHRKSPRKSPVVLVSDIFKSGSSKIALLNSRRSCSPFENGSNNVHKSKPSSPSDTPQLSYSHNISNFEVSRFMPSEISNDGKIGKDEDLLFLLEGIPPLPAWPV